MFRTLTGLGIALFLTVVPVWAQDDSPKRAVLDSLINTALENNPEIKASENSVSAAQYNNRSKGWLPDPMISLAISNVPGSSLALDETPMSGIAVGFTQKVPWPGKLSAEGAISGLMVENAEWRKTAVENRIIRSVKAAYYDYSFRDLGSAIVDENLVLLQSLVDVTSTKYANGTGMAADVLKAQTELAKMRDRELDYSQMRKLTLGNLNSLLDNPVNPVRTGSNLESNLPLPDYSSINPDSLLDNAVDGNPSLMMTETQTSIAAAEKSLASASYWPDFTVGLEYRLREAVPGDPVAGEDFVSAKIGMTVPLWFWRNQDNRVKMAQGEMAARQDEYRNIKRTIEYQVSSAAWEMDRLRNGFKLYHDSIIPRAEASLESYRIAYEVGSADFSDLLSAQMRLFELKIEELKIQRDYQIQSALLEELIGAEKGE
jgi:cobalt-zinc-cadmium efflux system outer membrane protein